MKRSRQGGFSPHEVGEASAQVHCGRAAAQHGQDAFKVEELQELMATAAKKHGSHTLTEHTHHFNKIMVPRYCYLSTHSNFSQKKVRTVRTSSHRAWLVGETSARKQRFTLTTSGPPEHHRGKRRSSWQHQPQSQGPDPAEVPTPPRSRLPLLFRGAVLTSSPSVPCGPEHSSR